MENSLLELESTLLPKYLKGNGQITNIRTKPLTAAGENYGSILLAVEIDVADENGKETICCVAKTVPKNDFIQEFFSSRDTFKKELGFYSAIVPALKNFQKSQGARRVLSCVADFYGGRLSIENDLDKFDEHAIILLENLKIKGYVTISRQVGFDLHTAKIVLKNLAILHAVPIALKIQEPETFENKVKPYLNHVPLFGHLKKDMQEKIIDDIVSILKACPRYHQYIDSVTNKCKKVAHLDLNPKEPREPFATLTHNDFWVNNVMIQKNDEDNVADVKIIDFQFTNYGSPAKDLLFFIFDCVQNDVITTNFEEIIETYHSALYTTLKELKINVSNFTLEKFQQEIEHAVKNTIVIFQCLAMLRPIFAVKEAVNEVENLTADNIIKFCEPSKEHKEKLYVLVEEFKKRNWL